MILINLFRTLSGDRRKILIKSIDFQLCKIKDDGTYMIKVPEDENAVFLVRYVVDEEVYFRKVDFNRKEELRKGVEAWD